MTIEKGQIWQHKETKQYIHIKEVTHFNTDTDAEIADIVTSGDCNHLADSKTYVYRKLICKETLTNTYKLVKVCKYCGRGDINE